MHSNVDILTVPTFPTLGSLRKIAKCMTLCDPLLYIAQPCSTPPPLGLSGSRKTVIPKVHFSDREKSYINGTQHKNPSTSTGKLIPSIKTSPHKAIIRPKSALKEKSPKATSACHSSMVQDIIALKGAFPGSCDTIGNICLGPIPSRQTLVFPPVLHAQRKVPIEYWEQKEHTLNEMDKEGVIAPITQPTKWVSSLTYPCKPDGTLCICLDPKDLNKAIVWELYKAPTLEEISHCLSGDTCLSKLDAKDGFWSIHLDEKSLYLTMFNTYCCRYHFLCISFGLKMSQDVFRCKWTRQ